MGRQLDVEVQNQRSLQALVRAVTLSQGEFSLILVRCNYAQLRDRILTRLQNCCPISIDILTLPESAKTLLTTLQTELGIRDGGLGIRDQVPQALFLFGMESLHDLDQVLIATNLVREELRRQFPFPLVLWANDDGLHKLERLAPDLYSWAGGIIQFDMPIPELVQSLKRHSDRLFSSILDLGDEQAVANWAIVPQPNSLRQSELKFALADLQASEYAIDPELQASLDFLLGQDAHSHGELETARELYESSLQFWLDTAGSNHRGTTTQNSKLKTQDSEPSSPTPPSSSSPPFSPIPYLERAACVLFYLGLWWRSYAVLQRAAYDDAVYQAYDHFRRSLILFTEEGRQDLVARFIIAQAETLQKMKNWEPLEDLARQALVLHKLYKDPVRQARDHGFLAETALARSDWATAKTQVTMALRILDTLEADLHADGYPADPHLEHSLELAHRYHYAWYLFMLARAEKELGNLDAAIDYLETARDRAHPHSDPPLYIQILRQLRDDYFDRGDYQLAFRTKQTRRLIEHQYGYRAFVGALRLQPQHLQPGVLYPLPPQVDPQTLLAQEIAASGRQKDLDALLNRLALPKNKLIVLHGPSGVGKSSIVSGGLVPMLQEHLIGERTAIAVLLESYTDWQANLEKLLSQLPTGQVADPDASSDLLHRFRTLTDRNYLPILILDQFEEFFFVCDSVPSRRPLYQFLKNCLNLPFVKVILSLRDDYLHYLLEFQRLTNLDIIDNDILGKDIRYALNNFTTEEAKTVIQSLTEQAQFYLPKDLIDAVVQDLEGELSEVRPIELQVVGAQLQAEDIKTLAEYRRKGPKQPLVQRSLEDVVKDCGPENEELARLILFLLTNDKGTRPLKTRDDLEADLIDLGLIAQADNLDLVLEVLVGSGLLFLIPEYPADLYQLVHEYLVSFIREQYKTGLVAEWEREREHRPAFNKRREPGLQQDVAHEENVTAPFQGSGSWLAMAGWIFLGILLMLLLVYKSSNLRVSAVFSIFLY